VVFHQQVANERQDMILDFSNGHVHKRIIINLHFLVNLNKRKTLAFDYIIKIFGNSGIYLIYFPDKGKERIRIKF